MMWMVGAVLFILLFFTIWGAVKGFVRVIYSMVAWVVIAVAVSLLTPHMASFLTEKTSIDEGIAAICEEKIRQKSREHIEEANLSDIEINAGAETTISPKTLEELGIQLPKELEKEILNKKDLATDKIADWGIYEAIAVQLTDVIMRTISFVAVFVLCIIVFHIIGSALHIVEKLPVLGPVNRGFGVLAGFAEGMCFVWFLLALMALTATTPSGGFFVDAIYKSEFMILLFENNPILSIILLIF